MRGLMQQQPLLVSSLLTFAARHHAGGEVVSNPVTLHTPRHRYAYPALEARARRLARVLQRLGVRRRDRIGTLAWNSRPPLELYYAVSGSGAVCHTINPRLFEDQLVYIIGHAEDHLVFADPLWAPLVEHLLPRLTHRPPPAPPPPPPLTPGPAAVVILADPAAMPALAMPAGTDLLCYETLMAEAD